MRRLAADETAKADNSRKETTFGRMLRGERDLERARHADDGDVARGDAGGGERGQRTRLQAVGDEVVVLRHDDGEPEPRRASCAFYRLHLFHSAKAFALRRPAHPA